MNSTQTLIGVGVAVVLCLAAATLLALRARGRSVLAARARMPAGDAAAVSRLENEGGPTIHREFSP